MERMQTLGFVLIFILLMGWLWLNTPPPEPQPETASTSLPDDTAGTEKSPKTAKIQQKTEEPQIIEASVGRFFEGRDTGVERTITIQSDLYRAVLSTKGGKIQQWELKQYNTWGGYPVQLVDYTQGDLGLLFGTTDGKTLTTTDLYFETPFDQDEVVRDTKHPVKLNAENFGVSRVLDHLDQS